MDRSLIKSMMPSLVAGHVPRNVRSFKYRVFDDQPQSSTLGFAIDPQPFDGKVVATNEAAKRVYYALGFKTYGVEPKSLCVQGQYLDQELIYIDFTDPERNSK